MRHSSLFSCPWTSADSCCCVTSPWQVMFKESYFLPLQPVCCYCYCGQQLILAMADDRQQSWLHSHGRTSVCSTARISIQVAMHVVAVFIEH